MGTFKQCLSSLLLAGLLGLPVIITGCAGHAGYGYRVYDPYARTYVVWGAGDQGYYSRCARENHRRVHRDFRKTSRGDQDAYWKWRHNQR